jgi:hypothetical protein
MTKIDDLEVGYNVPAKIGMAYEEIQTPYLILDLDALERNIKKTGDYAREHKHAPCRSVISVPELHHGYLIEIDGVALDTAAT